MKVLALVCLLTVTAVYAAGRGHVFFDRKTTPRGWTRGAVAPRSAPVRVTVALVQRNLKALEALFWSIATPESPNYRNFMSRDEILDVVAPEASDKNKVVSWLHSHGIRAVKDHRDALSVRTTVAHAAAAFQTEFYLFTEEETGRQIVRSWGTASMPEEIASIVDFVEGLSSFPVPHLKVHVRAPKSDGTDDTYAVIPQTVSNQYSIPAQSMGAHPETSVGVIEFQGESYAPADLAAYAQGCNIQIATITANDTVGPNDPTSPQIEAELDIEFAATVNPSATAWFWLEDGQGWLYQFVNHYFSTQNVPQVVSISYAWSEMDQCQIDPDECQSLGVDSQGYVARCNVEWQKIAMRGLSILTASGDSGANGRTDPDCSLQYLKPDYPACCPYITSVGATEIQNPTPLPSPQPPACSQGYTCIAGGAEQAVSYAYSDFASGGGFSWYSPMPSYQTDAVKAYLASGVTLPPATYYNNTNRGFPDIAAVGHDCLIYDAGAWEPVGGTSCSAPIVAAVMSVVNQAAIKKSGKPLGFLNPFLYKMWKECPTCFQDITVGDNLCTEDGCSPSCEGFYCTKGWDPVTGLGTPNAQAMINYVNAHL
jgi:subtilase family serine protease